MMKRKKRILIGGSIVLIAAICGAIFLFSGKRSQLNLWQSKLKRITLE